MARKDSEKEAERPHYYSQFWLDVAAGRRIIGAPKTNEEGDLEESDAPILPTSMRHGSSSDGYHETIAHPDVEADFENDDDVYAEPEVDLEDTEPIQEEDEEVEVPPIVVEEEEIPDVDFTPVDAEEEEENEEEEEDFYEEEEEDEEEDEDDIGWGGARGRKKPKPGRQAKLPAKPPVKKPTKRRGF
jgi:hypothetical protein